MALVSFGAADSRTTRTASATASAIPWCGSEKLGATEKATIMAPILARILEGMNESHIPVPHHYVVAVDHVGVAVPDFDAAVEWYRTNLGFINYHDEVNEEQGVHEAMLPAEKVAGGTLVQILAPLNDESTIAKYLDKKGAGIQQYAVRVTDLDA